MADIELVIKISKEDYNYILSQGDTRGTPHLAEAIRKGTPLPRGHGKLIDVSKLRLHEKDIRQGNTTWLIDVYTSEEIDNASTIVEADEEKECK